MNIRDHHSKFGFGNATRLNRDDFGNHHLRHAQVDSSGVGSGSEALTSFQDALSALGDSNPTQFAGVLSAIAGELRAAADSTRGHSSGLLDALADQFEGAAHANVPGDEGATQPNGSIAHPTDATPPTSVPPLNAPELGISKLALLDGSPEPPQPTDLKASEALLSRILDAVSSALAKVATDSTAGTVIVESVDGVTTTTTAGATVSSLTEANSTSAA